MPYGILPTCGIGAEPCNVSKNTRVFHSIRRRYLPGDRGRMEIPLKSINSSPINFGLLPLPGKYASGDFELRCFGIICSCEY